MAGRVALLGGAETGVGVAPMETGPTSGFDIGVGVDIAGLSGVIGVVAGVEMG